MFSDCESDSDFWFHLLSSFAEWMDDWSLWVKFWSSCSRILDLDLVVRDEDGNILDPELTNFKSVFSELMSSFQTSGGKIARRKK